MKLILFLLGCYYYVRDQFDKIFSSHNNIGSSPKRVGKNQNIVYQFGDSVECENCGRKIKIEGPPYEEGVKMVISADPIYLRNWAFRCNKCDFITCWKCSTKARGLFNPMKGISRCPSCGAIGSPLLFTEWLRLKRP